LKIISAFGPALAMAAAVLMACITASPAAPTQAQQQAIRSACPDDFQTHCAGVQPGGSAALQCLQKNVATLSPSCKQAVEAVGGASGATTPAPAATTTAPSEPAPAATTAAPGSKPAVIVLKPRQEIALMRQACGRDYRRNCGGVAMGNGGAVECLVAHASSLSSTCRGALGKLGQKF
jgi:hypothetical protein